VPRYQGAELKPLTVIHAPAGYGKTTLALQLLAEQPQVHLWMSCDALDNDPTRFWQHLICAFDGVQQGRETLASLGNSERFQLTQQLQRFFSEISASTRSATLVLDDFHHISNKDILRELNYLLDYLPATIRLIITSRTRPELRVDARILSQRATELTLAELALDAKQIQAYAKTVCKIELPLSQADAIRQQTEGWISAVKLMYLPMQPNSGARLKQRESLGGSHMALYQYLLEEVLSVQSPELIEFIHCATLFDRFCGDMFAAIEPGWHAFALITELLNGNLFIQHVASDRDWFRFHDLFKNCAQQVSTWNAEKRKVTRRKAAVWLEAQGYIADALSCYSQNEDWQDTARLVEQHGRAWLSEGQSATVRFYLASLPEAEWKTRPGLICMHVWLMSDIEKHRDGAALLSQALALHEQSGCAVDNDVLSDIYSLQAVIDRLDLNWNAVLKHTALALQYAEQGRTAVKWRSYATLGAVEYFRGNLQASQTHLYNAVKYALEEKHRYGLAMSAGYLCEVLYCRGELTEAEKMARWVCSEIEKTPFNHYSMGVWRFLALPELLRERREFEQADAVMNQLLTLFELDEFEALPRLSLLLRKWYLDFSQQRYPAALAVVEEIEAIELKMRFPSTFAHGTAAGKRARITLLQGNALAARGWLDRQATLIESEPFHLQHDVLTAVAILLAERHWQPADECIERGLARAAHAGWKTLQARWLLLQAVSACAQSRIESAKKALLQSFSLLYGQGYRSIYLDDLPLLQPLYQRALHDPAFSGYKQVLNFAAPDRSEPAPLISLSNREKELLNHVVEGMSDKQIARLLDISLGTVKTHLRNIFRKLGARNRAHAIALYGRLTLP